MRAAYGGKPLDEAWGSSLHRNTAKVFGRSFEWGIIAEDLPDEENRVVLHETLTDSDGIPAPKLIYKNSENTKRLIDFHLERAKEAMRAVRGMSDDQARDYLRSKQDSLMRSDKEIREQVGMKQFLDEKTYRPGLGPYRREDG